MSDEARPPDAAPAASALAAPTGPASDLLDRAEQAHREGRFATTRALLQQLKQRSEKLSADEQARTEALMARFRPDPLATALVIACLLLFVLAVARYWN